MFPTIYAILREQKPKSKIGVIYTWSGIGYLFPKQAVDKDDNTNDDSLTVSHAVQYIKFEKPNLLFLHFDGVDAAGHGIGWGTPAYYQAIQKMDGYIGRLIQAVKEAGIMDHTIILVTADHGGKGKSHGGKSIQEMEIPWILYGKGVKKDHKLDLSIMTFDTASTIAYIFGLKQPQVWVGRPVKAALRGR
jgi:predicted AlkP superfamily pyrophosphatase or phosphodiesterase